MCNVLSIGRLVALTGLTGVIAAAADGAVIYVRGNAPPAGDGSSWATAYTDLQDALAAALAGDEIWVAAATYTPAPAGGARLSSFAIPDGVGLYGGFDGSERTLDERDPVLNKTTLSGDLAGDDAPGFVNNDENAYHVITATGTGRATVIDGFTITAGHANGDADPTCFGGPNHDLPCADVGDCPGPDTSCASIDAKGAGMLILLGSPTVVNCRIVDNFAAFQGGGIFLKGGGHASFVDCLFSGNHALDNGGAMYLGISPATFVSCQYIDNHADRYAGASCNRDLSDAAFTSCTFSGNTAGMFAGTGGGAIVNAASSPTFDDCDFNSNTSVVGNGGAMYNKQGFNPGLGVSRPVITNCTFDANEAGNFGGAMYNTEQSEPSVTSSTFTGQAAGRGGVFYNEDGSILTANACSMDGTSVNQGGGLYNHESTAYLTDCSMTNGVATISGGGDGYGTGVYNITGDVTLSGCTISGNTAERYAAGLYSDATDGPTTTTLIDCTITGNDAILGGSGIFIAAGSMLTMDRCDVSNNTGSAIFGGTGLFSIASVADVRHTTFTGNASPGATVVAVAAGNDITCTNCLFADNDGGCVEIDGLAVEPNAIKLNNCTLTSPGVDFVIQANSGGITVWNSIIWNALVSGTAFTTITNSTVQFGYPGEGNIDVDPLFVDPDAGDWRLQPGSPSIDAGHNWAIVGLTDTDLDGNPRFADDPATADTGCGVPVIVDMGPYEFQDGEAVDIKLGDIDGDGTVGIVDFGILLAGWGACEPGCCLPDLDLDGNVGITDFLLLLGGWG